MFFNRALANNSLLRRLLLSLRVKVGLLDVAAVEQGLGEDEVRAADHRGVGLKLVALVVLPFNQVVVLALLTLDGCQNSFDFVKEDRTNPCSGLQLIHNEMSLVLCLLSCLLDVVEEVTFFHLLGVGAALDIITQRAVLAIQRVKSTTSALIGTD